MINNKKFNKEINKYLPFIKKICFGFADNEDELNDFTQEVLIQIWRKIDTFKGEAKLSTWIYRVTVNVCLYEVSKRNKNEKMKVDLMRSTKKKYSSSSNESKSDEDQITLLYKSIKQLTQLDRAIIMLYLEKKTHNEIAEIIGLSRSNVGVRINRIKKKLKQLMSNERN